MKLAVPIPEVVRQITPKRPRSNAQNPSLKKQPIVVGCDPTMAGPAQELHEGDRVFGPNVKTVPVYVQTWGRLGDRHRRAVLRNRPFATGDLSLLWQFLTRQTGGTERQGQNSDMHLQNWGHLIKLSLGAFYVALPVEIVWVFKAISLGFIKYIPSLAW